MSDKYTFLGALATNILQQIAISPKDVLVVLPNKRAKRVLQQEIAKQISTPQFSPQIVSINEFITSLSPLKVISNEELILHLYSIFVTFDSFKEEPFQKFLSWAPIFLSDINEIDLQLADASTIFANLSEIKELETTFLKGELSDFQNKYLHFYVQLADLYGKFTSYLTEQNIGYEGFIYRSVADQISQGDRFQETILPHFKGYQRLIFAGFHALSPAEMCILEFFYNHFNGEFFFDIDRFYEEKYAPFVKTLQNRLRIPDIHIRDDFKTIPKDIYITDLTGNMNQIYHAIDILNQIERDEGSLDQTALVFGDESLALPFVHAYDCTKANLTMGFPIQQTNPYQLLTIILDLTKNSIRFSKIQQVDHRVYYHKDILLFIQNPLIHNFLKENNMNPANIINDIIKNNQIFISHKDLPHFIPNLSEEGIAMLSQLETFFLNINQKMDQKSPDYYGISSILNGIQDTITLINQEKFSSIILDFNGVVYFLLEKINSLTIPFIGDFNKGLQVCGLLETRTLDYKNIIFLSINEGVLPKGKGQPSMIMFDVKNHFKLPTSTYKDSIFAYHFFRLMQRASQIHILYDNDSSSKLAEKSRFINQLEFEVEAKKLTSNVHIIKKTITTISNIKVMENAPISIYKSDEIKDKLKKLKYSPSSLAIYIRCPLAFYLSQIEKLEPVESVDENIENKVVGTIVHSILQTIFNQVKSNHHHAIPIIEKAISQMDTLTIEAFKQNRDISKADITRGKIFLATEIVKKNVLAYLNIAKSELQNNQFQVIGNELSFLIPMQTDFGEILLKGSIDRVDIRNNQITILDYKTGKVDPKSLFLTSHEELIKDESYKQLFQLLFYILLYHKDVENNLLKTSTYSSGIISFQDILQKNETYTHFAQIVIDKNNSLITFSSDEIKQFEMDVLDLLNQILNPEIPFSQTDHIDNCKYCDYKTICKR